MLLGCHISRPQACLTAWRKKAPRQADCQIVQDLIIESELKEICNDPVLNEWLALKAGTALHKVFVL